jgi:hypothetical protein
VHVIGIFATYHRQCSGQLIGRIIDKDVAQGATKRIFDPAGFIRQGGVRASLSQSALARFRLDTQRLLIGCTVLHQAATRHSAVTLSRVLNGKMIVF